jgi:hypothetical protein
MRRGAWSGRGEASKFLPHDGRRALPCLYRIPAVKPGRNPGRQSCGLGRMLRFGLKITL